MMLWEVLAVAGYLLADVFLGYLGWRRIKNASDHMLAGRKAHRIIMAVSYGATFISTSAIVGFGGHGGGGEGILVDRRLRPIEYLLVGWLVNG